MSSSVSRYDIVLYGASGFTGAYVLEQMVRNPQFAGISFAVAGRSESKLRKVLADVGKLTSKPELATKTPILLADSSQPTELARMAQQAKVIVNVVGPYRLHGEAIVRAAVENGASHVDISGEPAWIEQMQAKYGEQARQNGCYVVSACGWDSIPCDLGTNFLKQQYASSGATLSHAETFAQIKSGSAGYSFNAGTYQTLILGLWQAKNDGLGRIRKVIMPEKLQKTKYRPQRRPMLWWNEALQAYCLPFMGADKSIVTRSQYWDATANGAYPVTVETYILVRSWFWAVALIAWLAVFQFAVHYGWSRRLLQNYPGFCSGYLFKESGPTRTQAEQASFTYWFVGYGWPQGTAGAGDATASPSAPTQVMVARCDGPDAGYIATAGCVLASALTILHEGKGMPNGGGVYTTVSAFKETHIYDRLAQFGVTFRVDPTVKPAVESNASKKAH